MNIKKSLISGTIGLAVCVPLAVQLVMPAAASAARYYGPVVLAASPNSGPTSGGTTVTITGEVLTLVSSVWFGNVPASYRIVSSTEIIATSPAESAGTVTVEAKNGTALAPSGAEFKYS
jgi:hypothetical protein